MHIKRRTFLQTGTLATASLLIPDFLKAFQYKPLVPPGNKVLVIIQLNGGNDGLNTVVPYRNDVYYRLRPQLSIKKEELNRITDDCGLHPALQSFHRLYDEGNLAILNNVGYPNPNRSHFRSMDIWQSASDSAEYLNSGWVGRMLDEACEDCIQPVSAIEISDSLSQALKGDEIKGLALKDPRKLFHASNDRYFRELAMAHHHHEHEQPVDYLYKTMSETMAGAEYIHAKSSILSTRVDYPRTALGHGMKTIAGLILSNINTKVYYISLGSFDTHVAQQGQQNRHLTTLNDAIESFVREMKAHHRFNDVMLMTFSEFGRRVAQNGSRGTDHGAANNMFFISGGLKKQGILNALPDLEDLDNGDLKYTIDFKSVYATMLKKWLGADDRKILRDNYRHLDFI